MYVEDGTNFVLSEESIALWAQNTKAYVKAVKEMRLTYGRSHVRELEAQDMPALRLAGGHDGAHLPRVWGAAALSGRRSPVASRAEARRGGSRRPTRGVRPPRQAPPRRPSLPRDRRIRPVADGHRAIVGPIRPCRRATHGRGARADDRRGHVVHGSSTTARDPRCCGSWLLRRPLAHVGRRAPAPTDAGLVGQPGVGGRVHRRGRAAVVEDACAGLGTVRRGLAQQVGRRTAGCGGDALLVELSRRRSRWALRRPAGPIGQRLGHGSRARPSRRPGPGSSPDLRPSPWADARRIG